MHGRDGPASPDASACSSQLAIRDIVLIDRLELDFGEGLRS